MKVLCLLQLPDRVASRFREHLELIDGVLADADEVQPAALLCSIGPDRLDREALERLPSSVKAIGTYSVGYDHIDLDAATALGIAVFNTPGVLADAVADAAMLLILGAARRATEAIALLREGRWDGWTPSQLIGIGLRGRTLGILGMGKIGLQVAARARAFGMTIAYHNRHETESEDARFHSDPQSLIANSDVILLSWPSNDQTRYFINADTLRLFKPTALLVNIGRGDLVRDADLISALRCGRILGAALDVFDNEPDINSDYLGLTNAFLLPHIGSSTWEARLAMADTLIDAFTKHAAGEKPSNRIA